MWRFKALKMQPEHIFLNEIVVFYFEFRWRFSQGTICNEITIDSAYGLASNRLPAIT